MDIINSVVIVLLILSSLFLIVTILECRMARTVEYSGRFAPRSPGS